MAMGPIASSYSVFIGETVTLEFNFADPLVLETNNVEEE